MLKRGVIVKGRKNRTIDSNPDSMAVRHPCSWQSIPKTPIKTLAEVIFEFTPMAVHMANPIIAVFLDGFIAKANPPNVQARIRLSARLQNVQAKKGNRPVNKKAKIRSVLC